MNWFGRLVFFAVAMVSCVCFLAACTDDSPAAPAGAELPSDFPLADIPLLPNGTVQSAEGTAEEGWIINVQGSAVDGDSLDQAVQTLVDAGFVAEPAIEEEGQRAVRLTAEIDGKNYLATVGSVAGAAGGTQAVFYLVTRY